MPGDVTADEVYQDRELLERLGYGIMDVQWGSSGVGFENVKDFSYVVRQHEDPKLYRRLVFELTGKYYRNDLAKAVWDKFIDHKWVLSEQFGKEVTLKEAAEDWLEKYSHDFLKEWTFQQTKVPLRIRSRREPRTGLLSMVTGAIFPNLHELIDAGFSVTDIAWAKIQNLNHIGKKLLRFRGSKRGKAATAETINEQPLLVLQRARPDGFSYIRMVAKLTGHEIKDEEEATRRWKEILEHKWYMSEREGHDVGIRTAAIDYYRRLNLLAQTESGTE